MTVAMRRSASISGSFIAIGMFFANLHAATVEKVHASYGAISGSMLPIWVAKEGRLFDKHGLMNQLEHSLAVQKKHHEH
jgi:ABC-type nitrate/sulfonate/bicarbonate transport system substrate-binding protein